MTIDTTFSGKEARTLATCLATTSVVMKSTIFSMQDTTISDGTKEKHITIMESSIEKNHLGHSSLDF
jgi:hypothetical protein